MPTSIIIALLAYALGVITSALVFFCRREHPLDDVPFDEIEDFSFFRKLR